MRFTKTQVTEENQKARERGYRAGRAKSRRRAFVAFVFGIGAGIAGTIGYQGNKEQVDNFVTTSYHRIAAAIHPADATPSTPIVEPPTVSWPPTTNAATRAADLVNEEASQK